MDGVLPNLIEVVKSVGVDLAFVALSEAAFRVRDLPTRTASYRKKYLRDNETLARGWRRKTNGDIVRVHPEDQRDEGDAVKNPTEQEMVAAYAREFPGARIGDHERAFLAFLHIARSHGVGWGFMRQAVGMHWKEADPVGYIDDQRIIDLHTKPSKVVAKDTKPLRPLADETTERK